MTLVRYSKMQSADQQTPRVAQSLARSRITNTVRKMQRRCGRNRVIKQERQPSEILFVAREDGVDIEFGQPSMKQGSEHHEPGAR